MEDNLRTYDVSRASTANTLLVHVDTVRCVTIVTILIA
jgi:hypothetical protein